MFFAFDFGVNRSASLALKPGGGCFQVLIIKVKLKIRFNIFPAISNNKAAPP